jgi:hypothetical protein
MSVGGTTMTRMTDVIELRQYELVLDRRDALITLFEREFVESQESLGMHLIGTFVDLDDPDRFVWMRGFRDHATRPEALGGFYYGPVWAAHSRQANATMIDSDNVLLLRSTGAGPGFPPAPDGAAPDGDVAPVSMYAVSVYAIPKDGDEADLIRFFDAHVLPVASSAGAHTVGLLRTDPSENGFPALPVREGERVLVWIRRFQDIDTHARHIERLGRCDDWQDVAPALAARVGPAAQELRLAPTRRSRLR